MQMNHSFIAEFEAIDLAPAFIESPVERVISSVSRLSGYVAMAAAVVGLFALIF